MDKAETNPNPKKSKSHFWKFYVIISIVGVIVLVLIFTAYHGYYERCSSTELYCPLYGDHFQLDHVECSRFWKPKWMSLFFPIGADIKNQRVSALVFNNGERVLQNELSMNRGYYPARLYDGRLYESGGGRERIITISENGDITNIKEIESFASEKLTYSPVWHDEARAKIKQLTPEQIKQYNLKYPFHILQIIAPKFLP